MSEITTHIEKRTVLVPELRFKEFDDTWHKTKIGKLVSLTSGYAFKSEFFGEKGEKLLTPKNFTKGGFASFTEENTKYTIEECDAKFVCQENDLLALLTDLTPSCELLGKPVILTEKALLNQRIVRIEPKNELVIKGFLANVMLTNDYHKWVRSTATGTTVRHSSNEILKNYSTKIPSLPEQQKIASFLSAVDEKIQQLTRKKELLEDYKKGVMQQIFSQQIRFKDENGNDFPEWEEKSLGQLATRVKQKNSDNAENFVLTNSATQGVVSQQDYFDKNIANQSNLEGYYVVDVNDFVYNPRISVHAPVGPIKRNKLQKGVMSPLYSVFRFKNDDLDYFELFFKTVLWHRYLNSVANFGARHDRMNISNEDFYKMPIPFPCEKERKMISNYFKSISVKLETTTEQLTQVQTFKKGLLQKMFV